MGRGWNNKEKEAKLEVGGSFCGRDMRRFGEKKLLIKGENEVVKRVWCSCG